MSYADVEIRIRKQDKGSYPVEITVDSEREFPRGQLDADLEKQPATPTDAHYADPQYGQKLFEWFFTDDQLKTNWAENRGAYPQRRVRLRIDADEPRLHQVPWEALCEPKEEQQPVLHLAAHSATPFSRYQESKAVPGTPVVKRPIRILMVAPRQANFAQKNGQLTTANPVWAALQKICDGDDYPDFRTGKYIQLPLQAVQVSEGQDVSLHEQVEPQRFGTLDLVDAIKGHLAANPAAGEDGKSAAPLVLVVGGPGTSKSMQMKQLGWETVQAGLKSPAGGFFLPLYLGLPGGSPSTEALEEKILDRLRSFLPDLAARSLDDLSKQMPQVRLGILFSAGDTLPEVGRDLVTQPPARGRDGP